MKPARQIGLCLLILLVVSAVEAAPRSFSMRTTKITRRHYQTEVTYPVFRRAGALSRLANHNLKQFALKRRAAFLKSAHETLQQFTPPAKLEQDLAFASGPFQGPRLITGRFEQYEYLGGAHPMTMTFCFNFGLVNGHAKQLSLGDFFRNDSTYQKRVTQILLSKLRQQKADWIIEGVVSYFNVEQLNNFVAEKDGLHFYFDPYAVGPYAAGPYEVKLTSKDLGPTFRLPS